MYGRPGVVIRGTIWYGRVVDIIRKGHFKATSLFSELTLYITLITITLMSLT